MPPSPLPTLLELDLDAANGILDLTFNKAMDTGSLPVASDFEILLDGSPEVPDTITWLDADTLRFTFFTFGLPTSGEIFLPDSVSTLRGSDGSVVNRFIISAP